MLAYSLAALREQATAELPRPDVVIGSSVHPFAAVAGALLARRFNVPFLFEVRDLWPQTLVDMGRLKDGSFIAWAMRKLELWLYRRAARIIVLLPRAWQYIVPLGIPRERIVWIPNGVDLSLFPPSVPKLAAADGEFTLMYFGAHGQANGLDNVLQAMARLQQMPSRQRIHLRLIGDGPLKPTLIAQAASLDLRNVSFEPSVPKREIPMLASQADAFVISVNNLPRLYRFGVSMNKIFDYLAAARPILMASDIPENPVAAAEAGLVIPPSHPQALADAIIQIALTPIDEQKRMGVSGRKYVKQNHDFEFLAKRLAETLNSVV
jgi:glycosyltransferase involved in cell wall biosynthesis